MKTKPMICLVLAAVISAGSALGATDVRSKQGKLSSSDYKFLTQTMERSQRELALGTLASQKAQSPMIREFGQKMAQEHRKTAEELQQLAIQKEAVLPAASDPGWSANNAKKTKTAKKEEELSKLSGEEFDKAYLRAILPDHKDDAKAFEKVAKKANDPDVGNFAHKHVVMMKEHLRRAQSIHTGMYRVKPDEQPIDIHYTP
jgi:putative membrane protein